MFIKTDRKVTRARRHFRLRKRILGTVDKPRLSVFKSLKHFHVQLIDDVEGKTLLGLSSTDKGLKSKAKNMSSKEGAKLVGLELAKRALEKKIERVVFDRGGIAYHGSVKVLAEAAREGGLKF